MRKAVRRSNESNVPHREGTATVQCPPSGAGEEKEICRWDIRSVLDVSHRAPFPTSKPIKSFLSLWHFCASQELFSMHISMRGLSVHPEVPCFPLHNLSWLCQDHTGTFLCRLWSRRGGTKLWIQGPGLCLPLVAAKQGRCSTVLIQKAGLVLASHPRAGLTTPLAAVPA